MVIYQKMQLTAMHLHPGQTIGWKKILWDIPLRQQDVGDLQNRQGKR